MKAYKFLVVFLLLLNYGCAVSFAEKSMDPAQSLVRQNIDTEKERAMQLAKENKLDESLKIFQKIYDGTQPKITFDYITVLHWAGKNSEAFAIYEKNISLNYPEYMNKNLAAICYRIGKYDQSINFIKPYVDLGDKQAQLLLAQNYYLSGRKALAMETYDMILAKDSQKIDVYRSMSDMALAAQAHREATKYLQSALQLAIEEKSNTTLIYNLVADLANAYINSANFESAIVLLDQYVYSEHASQSMKGNYILALKEFKQYKKAISASKKLWNNYNDMPPFALKFLLACYQELGKYDEAEAIIKNLKSDNDDKGMDNTHALAFLYAISGNPDQSLTLYQTILEKGTVPLADIIRDADSFLNADKYQIGKGLFDLILAKKPEETAIRLRYADTLTGRNQNLAAMKQYLVLSNTLSGLQGLVKTNVLLGDYKSAKKYLTLLKKLYPENSLLAEATYRDRFKAYLGMGLPYEDSYKSITTLPANTNFEVNLDNNFWALGEFGRGSIDQYPNRGENTDQRKKISYTTTRVGLRYGDSKVGATAMVGEILGTKSDTTFQINTHYDFTDRQRVYFNYSRNPIIDVDTLDNPDNKFNVDEFSLNYRYKRNNQETFNLGVAQGSVSDGNTISSFTLSQDLLFKNDFQRTIYWRRTFFKNQVNEYESPELREAFGIGYQKNFPAYKGRVILLGVFNWERDYPDKIGFSPYQRISYDWIFNNRQTLTFAFEYGLHSKEFFGGDGLSFSYRKYEMYYNIFW